MSVTKPPAKKAAPKTPAPVAAPAAPAPTAQPADRKRAAHVLARSDEDGDLLEVELFTGEMAARRELDGRPDWKYLHLVPGQRYVARHALASSRVEQDPS